MAKDVLKWVGYLEEVARVKKSGQVDDDVRREAHIMWRRHENCNFIYEKAFESLFLYPKWKTRIRRYLPKSLRDEETNITQESDPDSSGSGKRVRLDEDDEVAVDDDSTGGRAFMSGGIVRPGGVKQAKAKKFKGKATSSCSEEVAMSLGENLKLHAEMRGVDINLQKEKLEFEKARERRRAEQLELEKQHIKAQNLKIKWDMLQTLLARSNLSQQEEAFKNKLMQEIYGNQDD